MCVDEASHRHVLTPLTHLTELHRLTHTGSPTRCTYLLYSSRLTHLRVVYVAHELVGEFGDVAEAVEVGVQLQVTSK